MTVTVEPGLVSIMMPVYNAAPFVAAAVQSVLGQTYSQWELIIIDDGSTDGSGSIVAGFDDPRLRVFTQANQGEAAARNAALRNMRGEFIAFLDADDLFEPHHLQVMVGYLQSHPDRDAVYGDGYHIDEEGAQLKSLSSRRRGPFEGDIFEQVVLASDVFGPPTCVVLRREPVVQSRLSFDEQIVIGPDWDFLTRTAEKMTFGYVDVHSCRYRVHRTNITRQVDARRRAGYLARCREKAISLSRFEELPTETRTAVFYDLLVELLPGQVERQTEITQWSQFRSLPAAEQARLYRLMARERVFLETNEVDEQERVGEWLERARLLQPDSWRSMLLALLYRASPRLFRAALTVKVISERRPHLDDPLADLH